MRTVGISMISHRHLPHRASAGRRAAAALRANRAAVWSMGSDRRQVGLTTLPPFGCGALVIGAAPVPIRAAYLHTSSVCLPPIADITFAVTLIRCRDPTTNDAKPTIPIIKQPLM